MTRDADFLVLGNPLFNDPQLAATARRDGALTAWQQAFTQFGTQAAAHVSGDFAVALRVPDGRVYLAVDRFSIRTLCYRQAGEHLYFDERADRLTASDTAIDPQAIFDYLYFHIIPSPRTIFQQIFRLQPGHYALFEHGQLSIQRYWHPKFEETNPASFEELRAQFRHLLEDGVRKQLDGSKAACYLSGGTDSSTVAGLIGQVSGQPAATYSIGFNAQGYDEMEYARIAARHFHTEHHEYYVTPEDLVRSIADVARYYDQPFGNSSALPAYYCAKMAREDGVTRLLGGDGGDELFCGNTRYAKQKIFGFYEQIPAALRSALLEPLLLKTPLGELPVLRKGASYIRQAKVPLPDRTQTYNLLFQLGVNSIFTADFLQKIDLEEPLQQQRQIWHETGCASQTNLELAFDWHYTLADCDLPKVVGTATMAGVEVGFPMLDTQLADFSLRLPTHYKLKGLQLRWFFKEALRGFLPDQIITKKKQGFGLPFGVWLTTNKDLRALAEDSIHALVERNLYQKQFADQVFMQLSEHPGYYGEMIWISIMLEQWLQAQPVKYSV